ncbi:MAG: hypothetical protein HUK25_04160, partial [Treponema sp.]|nr:hypothetical protein [Treponema sp.]
MNTITVCSYYGTGSSAITDLISEFDNVKSLTNFEFRFAHDPDGLSELEYNLVENFNRHNSGHALKRYKKFVDYYSSHLFTKRYEAFFKGKWKELSYKYINELTDFSFPGIWDFDFYDKGEWWSFWHKLPFRIIHKLHIGDVDSEAGLCSKETTYCSHPTEEKFLECTKKYTDALLDYSNPEKKEILMMDQILPSSNIERHMRYFSDVKAFVVDRDPRDLYLLAKYRWNSKIVPLDIDLFCKWFLYARSTRKEENWNPEKICFIQFEDLIYKYDETVSKIMDFAGLKNENHVNPKKYFNPDVSIKNTRLWEQNPEWKNEADYIAK